MEPITLPIFNAEGKEVESVKLNTSVFDGIVNSEAMYQVINAYRANQRKGLASTKARGEISGGGKKPWKQKGTGRARVGSTRSPLWRHGGVVFGPHPRDFSYVLPDKIKDVALKSSLNAKVLENNFIILDDLKLAAAKTKEALKLFDNLKLSATKKNKAASVLLLAEALSVDLKKALRNIDFLDFNLVTDTQTYEVMTHKRILITKSGLSKLTQRLKK